MADAGGLVLADIGVAPTFEWMQEYDGLLLSNIGNASEHYPTDSSGGGGQIVRRVPLLVRSVP